MKWTFGDGQTSATRSPSHAYSNPGTYSVTLTVRRFTQTLLTDLNPSKQKVVSVDALPAELAYIDKGVAAVLDEVAAVLAFVILFLPSYLFMKLLARSIGVPPAWPAGSGCSVFTPPPLSTRTISENGWFG